MSLETAKNPLKIKTDRVSVVQERRIETDDAAAVEKALAENMKADANIVVWQIDRIIWGRWRAGHIELAPKETLQPGLWQEVRVFNEDEELHLRREGKGFHGRYRKDTPTTEEGTPYVDSFSRFWGESDGTSAGGYVTLVDGQRKLRLVVPAEGGVNRYGLQTRNYVGSDEKTGLSGYIDYRFVHIASAEEGN